MTGEPRGLIGGASRRPGITYLGLRIGFLLLARGIFGFRIRLEGATNLPRTRSGALAGGWIAAAFPHRTWVDPFVVIALLSPTPRLAFFGDGRTIFRSRTRRFVAARLGGILPIWAGGGREGVETYLDGAREALDAGAVFLLFPEAGPPAPVELARPFGRGLGYFALRSGAPIVPMVLGGTHELFRGRQIVLRVLPVIPTRELAGLASDEPWPPPWSVAERRAAARLVTSLRERCAEQVADAHQAVEPVPGTRKRWLRLTHLWQ